MKASVVAAQAGQQMAQVAFQRQLTAQMQAQMRQQQAALQAQLRAAQAQAQAAALQAQQYQRAATQVGFLGLREQIAYSCMCWGPSAGPCAPGSATTAGMQVADVW